MTQGQTAPIRPLIILLLLAGYLLGAWFQGAKVNTNPRAHDQSAYMNYAKGLRAEGYFTHEGDRNRMPIYPGLIGLFYRPGMSDETFFRRAKIANVILSLLLLAGTWFILRRWLPRAHTDLLTAIAAFTVFMFKAPYVQCELLFYFLNLCAFVTMWKCLREPTLLRGGLAGLLAALAHLTKAAMLPAVALFGICFLIGRLGSALKKEPDARRRLPKEAAVLALFVVIFLGVLSPYLATNQRRFGRVFYNVNSTFYVWTDSWDEAMAKTHAHGDARGWPDMPPEEIPSPGKYLREHSAAQIVNRFTTGAKKMLLLAYHTFGYFKYFALCLILCMALLLQERGTVRELTRRSGRTPLAAFLWLWFIGYFLLYAFYAQISISTRFFLAQFLPVMLVFFVFLSHPALQEKPLRLAGLRLAPDTFVRFLGWLFVTDLVFTLPFRISIPGGN